MPGFDDALRKHPRAIEGINQMTLHNAVFFKDFLGIDGGELHRMRGVIDANFERYVGESDELRVGKYTRDATAPKITKYLNGNGFNIDQSIVDEIIKQEFQGLTEEPNRGAPAR